MGTARSTEAVNNCTLLETWGEHNAVFVGNEEGARDVQLLRDYRITHIINCVHDQRSAAHLGISYCNFHSDDLPWYTLLDHLKEVQERLSLAESTSPPVRVFFHCREGLNRSVAMAIAFMVSRAFMRKPCEPERLIST